MTDVISTMTIEEVAQMAAQWWVEVIQNPKQDNGDPSISGMVLIGYLNENKQVIPEENLWKFKDGLTHLIQEQLEIGQEVSLTVDYSPKYLLAQVASAAKIPEINFPIKTGMWVSRNHVAYIYGYGQPKEFLYICKGYWQDRIDSCRFLIAKYEEWITNPSRPEDVIFAKEIIDGELERIVIYEAEMEKVE